MVSTMKDQDLQDMVGKVVEEFKSEADFEAFTKALRKQFWESTLEGELDDHLGYEKHSARGNGTGNSRNGKSAKRIRSEHGELAIEAPRDRNGSLSSKPSRNDRLEREESMTRSCFCTQRVKAQGTLPLRSKSSTT
jgi:transposase-like protein